MPRTPWNNYCRPEACPTLAGKYGPAGRFQWQSAIKFTNNFQDDFRQLYLIDFPVKDIFRTLGYDPEILGTKTIDGFFYNLRKTVVQQSKAITAFPTLQK